MARFVKENEQVYDFVIEEKHIGSISIYANSFEEALDFLREQYELHDHETQKFFNLRQYSTTFIDEIGNEYPY